MSSIFGTLNIGRQGLFVQQAGLNTVGQNIANVNTPGYSRQRVIMEPSSAGGVLLTGVERLRDEYLNAQLLDNNTRLEGQSSTALNLQHVEAILGGDEQTGVSQTIRDFFNALQDLSLKPSGSTEHQAVVSRTRQMTSTFSSVTEQLRQMRTQLDRQVTQQVDRINSLTESIAKLNERLVDTGAAGTNTSANNELLDHRDQLIDELSGIVPVKVIRNSDSTSVVFVAGQAVVEGINRREFMAVANPSNDGYHELALKGTTGEAVRINKQPAEGSLGALIEARDTQIKSALDNLDRLAAQMIRDLNAQHRDGVGLDNIGNRDLLAGLQATATAAWLNDGGAAVDSTAILDESLLTFDDYEIEFTAADRYRVVDKTTGVELSNNNPYVSGGPIDFAGMRVVLSDDTGAPAAGDVFTVNAYAKSTDRMDLSSAVAGDIRAIAAGLTDAPGDNRNVLNLIALQDASVMGNPPNQNFESFYDNIRLELSLAVEGAQNNYTDEQIMQQQLQSMVESVSGVSIDEEAIDIIKFQRAFEASGRMISVTDELLQSLLRLV